MADEPRGAALCAVCAWRATCNKKFSVSKSKCANCAEFTRDVTLGKADKDAKGGETDGRGGR